MRIKLEEVTKKYEQKVLFQGVSFDFVSPGHYYIQGINGSGKSSLIKMLSGFLLPDRGNISYFEDSDLVPKHQVFSMMSMATPYLQLKEELTLTQHLSFHFSFKKKKSNISIEQILEESHFFQHQSKRVSALSSGLKQRLKLVLAFFSDTPVLLLDEPCANLDKQNIIWYQEMLKKHAQERLVIIASNSKPEEIDTCSTGIILS